MKKGIRGLIYLPPPLLCSKAQQWTGKCSWQRLKNVSHTPTYTYQAVSGLYGPKETTEIPITTQIFHFGFNFLLSSYSSTSLNLAIFYGKKNKSLLTTPQSLKKKYVSGKILTVLKSVKWNLSKCLSLSVCLYLFVSAPFSFGLILSRAFHLRVFQSVQICLLNHSTKLTLLKRMKRVKIHENAHITFMQ